MTNMFSQSSSSFVFLTPSAKGYKFSGITGWENVFIAQLRGIIFQC